MKAMFTGGIRRKVVSGHGVGVDNSKDYEGLASLDSGVTTRTFDAACNNTSTKHARGQLTTIDHDALCSAEIR